MHALLLPEPIPFHILFAPIKDDIGALGIDVQVPVLAADGAVAICDFLRFERGGEDFVGDGAAVAVCRVPDFGRWWRSGGGHDKGNFEKEILLTFDLVRASCKRLVRWVKYTLLQ